MPLDWVHHQVVIAIGVFAIKVPESIYYDIDGARRARGTKRVADIKKFATAIGRVGNVGFAAAVLSALLVPGWTRGSAAHERERLVML